MKKILLVDDNADYLRLLKDAFSASGYDVHTAEDGMEGCKTLTLPDIDLIISDIRMPKLDGIKLHSFARKTPRYKTVKFIFLSGFKDEYGSIPGMNSEIDYFLDKTTPIDVILKMVDQLLFGTFAKKWL
jgi:DNA-binding response OmpR family regulator